MGRCVLRRPVLAAGLVLLVAAGCGKQINPAWCAQHGDDPECPMTPGPGGPDAAEPDSPPEEDAGPFTTDSGPPGTCSFDEDCPLPFRVCRRNGICATRDNVLFAAPNGIGTACLTNARCTLPVAIAESSEDRELIFLQGGVYPGPIEITRSVRIGILVRCPNGNCSNVPTIQGTPTGAITVNGGAEVELRNIDITGAGDAAISCTEGTLVARGLVISGNDRGIRSACALTLERSTLARNSQGALLVTGGTITIRNNFIVNNGNEDLMSNANVEIAAGVTGTFAFNTVAHNDAKQNQVPGVDCKSAEVTVPGNLITENTRLRRFGGVQVSGRDFTPSYTVPGAGENDLQWVSVEQSDFHLTTDSMPALDISSLNCDGLDDFDGEPRPLNNFCDYGADELGPN
jgi:hypothetical protein